MIENNSISFVSDYIYPIGTKFVIRNNTVGPSDPNNTVHIDFVQMVATATFGLVEGNVSIGNFSADNHFFLDQCTQSHNWILRENAISKGSGGFLLRAADNVYLYNNTIYGTEAYYDSTFQFYDDNGSQCGDSSNSSAFARNNIWDDAVRANGDIYFVTSGSSIDKNNDLWFNSGNPVETQSTNANPLFVNAAGDDFHLTSSSPARKAGSPLTMVDATDSGNGTSLVVVDAQVFQDGWAGVSPDWIAVGSP